MSVKKLRRAIARRKAAPRREQPDIAGQILEQLRMITKMVPGYDDTVTVQKLGGSSGSGLRFVVVCRRSVSSHNLPDNVPTLTTILQLARALRVQFSRF